jgi:hypothetical protein
LSNEDISDIENTGASKQFNNTQMHSASGIENDVVFDFENLTDDDEENNASDRNIHAYHHNAHSNEIELVQSNGTLHVMRNGLVQQISEKQMSCNRMEIVSSTSNDSKSVMSSSISSHDARTISSHAVPACSLTSTLIPSSTFSNMSSSSEFGVLGVSSKTTAPIETSCAMPASLQKQGQPDVKSSNSSKNTKISKRKQPSLYKRRSPVTLSSTRQLGASSFNKQSQLRSRLRLYVKPIPPVLISPSIDCRVPTLTAPSSQVAHLIERQHTLQYLIRALMYVDDEKCKIEGCKKSACAFDAHHAMYLLPIYQKLQTQNAQDLMKLMQCKIESINERKDQCDKTNES